MLSLVRILALIIHNLCVLLYNSPLNPPRGTFESERPLGQGVARRVGVIIVDVPEFSKVLHLMVKLLNPLTTKDTKEITKDTKDYSRL